MKRSLIKKMWYDCQWNNYPQKTKMTQTFTTIGHRTAFNNEQSPYRIVSYKRPRNNNVKRFKRDNQRPNQCRQKLTKNKYVTHKQTITTKLQESVSQKNLRLRMIVSILNCSWLTINLSRKFSFVKLTPCSWLGTGTYIENVAG